jgi:hypothetical protein
VRFGAETPSDRAAEGGRDSPPRDAEPFPEAPYSPSHPSTNARACRISVFNQHTPADQTKNLSNRENCEMGEMGDFLRRFIQLITIDRFGAKLK